MVLYGRFGRMTENCARPYVPHNVRMRQLRWTEIGRNGAMQLIFLVLHSLLVSQYVVSQTTVPCSPDEPLTCPRGSRCLTHSSTGDSFCLESCFMENGGCPSDQTCYLQHKNEPCDPLLESCYNSTCHSHSGSYHNNTNFPAIHTHVL